MELMELDKISVFRYTTGRFSPWLGAYRLMLYLALIMLNA
jgi:hypothetical protein